MNAVDSARRSRCARIRIALDDPKIILAAWEDHFRAISSANTELSSAMCSSEQEINKMMHNSFNNEDCLLDVPFVSEEVDSVLKKLKLGKAAGHDGVQAEHLKYGGPILRDWILQICNAITELEHVYLTSSKLGS